MSSSGTVSLNRAQNRLGIGLASPLCKKLLRGTVARPSVVESCGSILNGD